MNPESWLCVISSDIKSGLHVVGWFLQAAEKEELERLGFTLKIYRPSLGGWRGDEPSSEQWAVDVGGFLRGMFQNEHLKSCSFSD